MSKTIILKDSRFMDHITMQGHPESPQRLKAIYRVLQESYMKDTFQEVTPPEATKEQLSLNHSVEYIERIATTAGKSFVSLDPDTNTSEGSWQAAILAAGAVIMGVDMILDGKADNGFALVRPPGHHAEQSRAMGFCLFNNIAIGAHYLLKNHTMKRILIVDWDLHHGNGTQNSFYSNPEVLYFSTHQFPYYPGSGSFDEIGAQEGKGFTVNVPLPGGQGDADYLVIFSEVLQPIVESYKPQFILVSAGYDTYHLDPLGTMDVTPNGFCLMTKFLKTMAEKYCNGRLLLALEGGYHVEGVAQSVEHTIHALTSAHTSGNDDEDSMRDKAGIHANIQPVIEKVKKTHSAVWSVFK